MAIHITYTPGANMLDTPEAMLDELRRTVQAVAQSSPVLPVRPAAPAEGDIYLTGTDNVAIWINDRERLLQFADEGGE